MSKRAKETWSHCQGILRRIDMACSIWKAWTSQKVVVRIRGINVYLKGDGQRKN